MKLLFQLNINSTDIHTTLDRFDFKDDIIIPAKLNDYWGYIDNKHNTQIPFEYDDALPFINKYAKVKKDDKWGLIDIKNNIIFGCFYREISDKFSDDLIRIGKGVLENNATVTKFGYFDSEGKEIIVCKYDFAEDFQNGRAKISLNGIEGVIDTSGIEYW